ncbi:MAG TPA: hypothetical protein VF611_03015, partial [Pyrinomonadaceae bacterium]
MSYRNLARALLLFSSLLTGCLVEPSPNAPANGGGAGVAENRAAPSPGASPEVQASPVTDASPEASPSTAASAEPGGKLETYVRAVAAGLPPEQ